MPWGSLNPTGNLRENCVGIGANQPDHADDNHENDGKHDRVLGYILSLYFTPNALQKKSGPGAHGAA